MHLNSVDTTGFLRKIYFGKSVVLSIHYQWSMISREDELTHFFPPLRFRKQVPTFAVRETASLGIMGEPRVPPLNPSEMIVL